MNSAVYEKQWKNLRNRIDIKLASNKKDYLKWKSKPKKINLCGTFIQTYTDAHIFKELHALTH